MAKKTKPQKDTENRKTEIAEEAGEDITLQEFAKEPEGEPAAADDDEEEEGAAAPVSEKKATGGQKASRYYRKGTIIMAVREIPDGYTIMYRDLLERPKIFWRRTYKSGVFSTAARALSSLDYTIKEKAAAQKSKSKRKNEREEPFWERIEGDSELASYELLLKEREKKKG